MTYQIKSRIRGFFPTEGGATVVFDNSMLRDFTMFVPDTMRLYDYLCRNVSIDCTAEMNNGHFVCSRLNIPRVHLFHWKEGKRIRVPLFERELPRFFKKPARQVRIQELDAFVQSEPWR